MATFSGFEAYHLDGVQQTGQELGHGSYATVLELKYMGLKCAGKKIHDLLLNQTYVVNRFGEECSILSRVRHPNIVQFMGLFFEKTTQTPILVMEFLPTDLTTCIKKYGKFPQEISYSILYNVALGLCYLHGQVPPIIHRDLSSNNVLLTTNMTAKISDLGMAKILDLTSMAQKKRTKIPGTPDFMPPEVMIPNPKYDKSIDDFSYGIIMIHVLSGQWPQAQVEYVRIENGHLIPVSEAERREVFLQDIGDDHPLMDLILKCINNDPNKRADANEIVERLEKAILQHPATFDNRLKMLKDFKTEKEAMKKEIQEKHQSFHEQLEQQNAEILELKMNIDDLKKQIDKERQLHKFQLRKQRDRLSLEMQSDVVAERLENESLKHALEVKDDDILRKDSEIKAQSRIIEEKDSTISRLSEQFSRARDYLASKQQTLQAHIIWKECCNLPTKAGEGQAVVINEKVYFGGCLYDSEDLNHNVFCYDPSKDQWTMLPPLPDICFGLGQVDDNLVAVGIRYTEVHTYNESSKEWKETIPPMPTGRLVPGVMSIKSILVVVGGVREDLSVTDAVEIFDTGMS